MDRQHYDFKNIQLTHQADADGDKAFDEDTFALASLPASNLVQLGF